MRCTRSRSCARAASGQPMAMPPMNEINSRRLMHLSRVQVLRTSIAGQAGASQQKPPAHVRLGSFPSMSAEIARPPHFRFAPKADENWRRCCATKCRAKHSLVPNFLRAGGHRAIVEIVDDEREGEPGHAECDRVVFTQLHGS